jgi:mono/diheme cytochrome c family protein
MVRSIINGTLVLLFVLVVLLTWGMRRDFTQRNDEMLPGMVESVPYDAQASNANFSDGKTLRDPVPGGVAQGFTPLHYRPTPDEAVRAGAELRNPYPDTLEAVLERGASVFATFCQPCHGAGALGDGPVVTRGFPPPPSLFADKATKMHNGQMFHIITYGQGNMPSLVSQITREDRWKVIRYVRSLQRKQVLATGK